LERGFIPFLKFPGIYPVKSMKRL